MKKPLLILLTLVPIVVGFLNSFLLFIPLIGTLLYYVLPLAVLVFWFILGRKFAATDWHPAAALLIGNASGLASMALFIWQYVLVSEAARIPIIGLFSQLYTSATPTYLFAGLAMLFENQPDPNVTYVGVATLLATQIIALVLMAAVFTIGYFSARKREKAV